VIHFDEVLNRAFITIASDTHSTLVESVLVLRDLRGRIRLFLKPAENREAQLAAEIPRLNEVLSSALEMFWGGVVEVDIPGSDFQSILDPFRAESRPLEPAAEYPNWSIIERHASKSSWTSRLSGPPWPLHERTPSIVAFYSHKGGVGRTTSLCGTAVNLARAGKKVVMLDLDLEAPGLGSLIQADATEFGVLDYLLERLLCGGGHAPDLRDYSARQSDQNLIGEGGEPIICIPAGSVNELYIEKLARVDLELLSRAPNDQSPLVDLLKLVKSQYRPDYILLDCRPGLNDLGGLAIQRLSHVNVLFGQDSVQSWQGMRYALRVLGITLTPPACLLVQAMEWPSPDEIRRRSRERFLSQSYDTFCEFYYDENDIPDIDAVDEPHFPFGVPYLQSLTGYQTLADIAELLTKDPYLSLTTRIVQLCERAKVND